MSGLIDAIKSNVLFMVCLLVIVASLGSFYFPTHTSAVDFKAKVEKRSREIKDIGKFYQTRVKIPPSTPNATPPELKMVVTEQSNDRLASVYRKMKEQYTGENGILRTAIKLNQEGHNVMLDGLFPRPSDALRFQSRNKYATEIVNLSQTLASGQPPSAAEREALLAKTEEDFRHQYNVSTITEETRSLLLTRQAEQLRSSFVKRASQISLYADQVALKPSTGNPWQPGPFQVGDWAKGQSTAPAPNEIWEGQMQLWVMQDIVAAIQLANQTDQAGRNVTTNPIKRLLKIFVDSELPLNSSGVYSAERYQEAIKEANHRLKDDFTQPTGHKSNALYGVRNALLEVVVDAQRINEVIDAIHSVNFMTVTGVQSMEHVDDYAHFAEGYYYGDQIDCVKLTLNIETLWFRYWTAGHMSDDQAKLFAESRSYGLMPDASRIAIGLPPHDPNFTPNK